MLQNTFSLVHLWSLPSPASFKPFKFGDTSIIFRVNISSPENAPVNLAGDVMWESCFFLKLPEHWVKAPGSGIPRSCKEEVAGFSYTGTCGCSVEFILQGRKPPTGGMQKLPTWDLASGCGA